MNKTLIVLIFIFIYGSVYAEVFNVGSKEIVVSSPQGFTRVTQEMDAVYRFSLHLTGQRNDQLAYYISDSDIPTAIAGELPSLDRTFSLKVSKQLKNMIVGSKGFDEIKDVIKHQNKEILESIKSRISNIMEEVSEGVSKEFDINFAIKNSKMVPLDPHYEKDNALAYSMYINYGISMEGAKTEEIVSSTATLVNLSGKVLFLYCYGPKDELEWTRSASKLWVEKVMDSNPPPPLYSIGGSGLDWNRIFKKGMIGFITGGLITLILGIFMILKKRVKK